MFFRNCNLIIAKPELSITTKDLKKAKKVLSLANFVLSIASFSLIVRACFLFILVVFKFFVFQTLRVLKTRRVLYMPTETACRQRQPAGLSLPGCNKIRIKQILFIIEQRRPVRFIYFSSGSRYNGVPGSGIPLHCRSETRINISFSFGNHT